MAKDEMKIKFKLKISKNDLLTTAPKELARVTIEPHIQAIKSSVKEMIVEESKKMSKICGFSEHECRLFIAKGMEKYFGAVADRAKQISYEILEGNFDANQCDEKEIEFVSKLVEKVGSIKEGVTMFLSFFQLQNNEELRNLLTKRTVEEVISLLSQIILETIKEMRYDG